MAKDERQEHLAELLAPSGGGSLLRGMNSLRQKKREPWWELEVRGHWHAQEVVSGRPRADSGVTTMSPRLGLHDSSLLRCSSHQ